MGHRDDFEKKRGRKMNGFIVEKVLNNNVVIATHPSYGEVVTLSLIHI